jgi:ABC-type glycerol-3-phosphate transport system substrate-binding protein
MRKKSIYFILALLFFSFITGCSSQKEDANVVKVVYWEKWTGFEGEAMQAVVDLFNSKEFKNRDGKTIVVEMVTVSQIDRRLLTATAGGNPPDVAGVWTWMLTIYADKGALTNLDDYLIEAGIGKENYLPAFWDICQYKGKMWGLVSTPASVALHWNRRLFREAGLDPNKPPETIAELDLMAEKLTKIELPGEDAPVSFYELKQRDNYQELLKKGKIVQLGFLHTEPNWYPWYWGYFFGGQLWNGKDTITADAPENVLSYDWVRSYSLKYGVDNIKKFSSSFGVFASPQNAFLSSKVAMVADGVWLNNFIEKYAAGMDWAAAPFPSYEGKLKDVAYVEADVLVVPKGARHPDEAFKFMSFVNSQEGMELLCKLQRKFSPLKEVSPDFYKGHKNPYIKMFRRLAESPNAFIKPKMVIWQEYEREMSFASELIRDLKENTKETLLEVRMTMQKRLDRELEMSKRLENE